MSGNLLPESVNLFLDDFETSLCLPILAIMVLCTVQFVFNRIINIVYMIYQAIKRPAMEEAQNRKLTDTMGKLKGILTTLGIGNPGTAQANTMKNPLSPTICTHSREEDWDYCEEDVE